MYADPLNPTWRETAVAVLAGKYDKADSSILHSVEIGLRGSKGDVTCERAYKYIIGLAGVKAAKKKSK